MYARFNEANLPAHMAANYSEQSIHDMAEHYDPEWSEDTATPISGDHLPR